MILAALLSCTPILLQAESPLNQELKKSGLKQKFKKFVLLNVFKKISGFLYIGEQNRLFFKNFQVPDGKLYFAPYAVNNERYDRLYSEKYGQKMTLRGKHNLPTDKKVILFVGKLFQKKRPWTLLKAFEALPDNHALVFVGDGEFKPEMESYVEKNKVKNVYFVGFKNQLELPEFYLLSDVFVLPSGEGETWGLVVNEAMCFGLPIVVSNMVGCSEDLVKEGVNGYKFSLDNVEELTEALLRLNQDPDLTSKMGEKSREIIKNYSHENDVQAIFKALSNHG